MCRPPKIMLFLHFAYGTRSVPTTLQTPSNAGEAASPMHFTFSPRSYNSCCISRTARSRPTKMALETILWPMFSSCMPSMPATCLTF